MRIPGVYRDKTRNRCGPIRGIAVAGLGFQGFGLGLLGLGFQGLRASDVGEFSEVAGAI